ncbi:MAG: FixH family protein [Burkholderiaceae bacterium]|nr:FixH family protein [Burkholderiaceae bacterium]
MTSVSSAPKTPVAPSSSTPWWKFGYVWLIIFGPAAVVVAGFYTLWLAVRTPDPVVDSDYYRKGIEINSTLKDVRADLVPAVNGRNHAATPQQDRPR